MFRFSFSWIGTKPRTFHTVVIAGHPHVAADPLTGTASEILTATGTEWPTH
ncbi:hypothetical protein ACFWQJ_12800 [Kocuria palustris]|uniref:hypothetical protein n=1 Tax=Kocuria palustris TaxID=71999 RepID=UPI003653FB57